MRPSSVRKAFVVVTVAVALSACATTHSTAASDCPALVGPEPWLIMFEGSHSSSCVAAGIHQDLQIWNKGTDTVTMEWVGVIHEIDSDEHYSTGPLGEVVEPGEYQIDSSPYAAPTLKVVDPNDSFGAETGLTLDGFGDIEVGMTLKEAAAASGQEIVVDVNLSPGPDCWHAVIPGDPYSPIFTVAGDSGEDSVIEFITTFYPSDSAATVGNPQASVPSLCG
jgi:hypothetical protein